MTPGCRRNNLPSSNCSQLVSDDDCALFELESSSHQAKALNPGRLTEPFSLIGKRPEHLPSVHRHIQVQFEGRRHSLTGQTNLGSNFIAQ